MVTNQMMRDVLLDEYHMFKLYGTKYRFVTVEKSLEVLSHVHSPEVFSNRESSLELVTKELKNEDLDRNKDVAKLLNVTFKQLKTRQNQTDSFRKKVNERKKANKQITLTLVKK
ncbi:hypothetical protein LNK15_08395 [Jeotgalicoccus huakuii]|nr:hypothetical protein [Jeotgalicoccus huakuii]